MKKIYILPFILILLTFGGCGGSVSIDPAENISRAKPKELFITLARELYFVGEEFDYSFTATDEYDKNITENVTIEGSVDTSKEGEYELLYKLIENKKEIAHTSKTIKVKINRKPQILLYGEEDMDIYLGDTYEEPGFEAKDEEDGDISDDVLIESSLDTSKEGIYTIVYTVTDSFGNRVGRQRQVRVIPPDDIRETVLVKSGYDKEHMFSLWDYMVNKRDSSFTVTKYRDNLKTGSQTDTIKRISPNEYGIGFPYTLREIHYIKNGDNTMSIAFKKESDTVSSVTLHEKVKLNTPVTTVTPTDDEKSCRISGHYEKIKLNDIPYVDVIKMVCGPQEAYFEKDKGIILQNTTSLQTEAFSLYGMSYPHELNLKPIVDTVKTPLGEMNLESMIQSNTYMLAYEPYNLNAEGMKIGVVDEGSVRSTHQEFDSRVLNVTSQPISPHTTHVAGTIAASGVDKDARGYANKASIEVISYYDVFFAESAKDFYDRGVLITNHSYGPADYYSVGEYGMLAWEVDKLISDYPEILVINAAGNDRTIDGYDSYGIIKDFGNAKNVITVGAVNYDDTIAYFSSTGPVKNGRIKPDIVAKGYSVKSVGYKSDDSYLFMSGTSMASPAVTGAVALLQEEYMKINDAKTMREDVVKAIIVNSAKDLGRKGPDYEFGFGLLDSLEAVKVIDSMNTEASLVQLRELDAEQKHIYDLNLSSLSLFKATLCWIDPAESSDPTGELVNDLDMIVVDEDYRIVYSFSLDGNDPSKAAVNDRYNRVDNIEQIEIKLPKGEYRVIVTSHKMKTERQNYVLVSNIALPKPVIDSSYSPVKEFETAILDSIR